MHVSFVFKIQKSNNMVKLIFLIIFKINLNLKSRTIRVQKSDP